MFPMSRDVTIHSLHPNCAYSTSTLEHSFSFQMVKPSKGNTYYKTVPNSLQKCIRTFFNILKISNMLHLSKLIETDISVIEFLGRSFQSLVFCCFLCNKIIIVFNHIEHIFYTIVYLQISSEPTSLRFRTVRT